MNDRLFLWGLSNGVMVFAVAGAFWLGLAIGMNATWLGGMRCGVLTVVQAGGCVALLWGAVRLRRKSRFRPAELRSAEGRAKQENQHIMAGFRWTVGAQTVLIAAAVWWFVRQRQEEMIWPAIALVVSLHLVPLARIFHVRAYYVAGAAGTAVSLVTFAGWTEPYAVACLGAAMAMVMWLTAAYVLREATRIAARAMGEPWAV